MTVGQLMLAVQGYQDRQREDMQARAWEVAHIIAPWCTEPVTPADLLPGPAPPKKRHRNPPPEKPEIRSKADYDGYMKARIAWQKAEAEAEDF